MSGKQKQTHASPPSGPNEREREYRCRVSALTCYADIQGRGWNVGFGQKRCNALGHRSGVAACCIAVSDGRQEDVKNFDLVVGPSGRFEVAASGNLIVSIG